LSDKKQRINEYRVDEEYPLPEETSCAARHALKKEGKKGKGRGRRKKIGEKKRKKKFVTFHHHRCYFIPLQVFNFFCATFVA